MLGWAGESDWYPDLDALETDKELIVYLEVPGIKRDAIHLDMREGYLIISGEKPGDQDLDKSDNVRLTERDSGRFRRSLRVPDYCNTDDIQANLGNFSYSSTRQWRPDCHDSQERICAKISHPSVLNSSLGIELLFCFFVESTKCQMLSWERRGPN